MYRPVLLALATLLPLGAQTRPKLVVVISVDQLSEANVELMAPRFNGGLARLLKEGAWFTQAYHAHASTETGPGHSVLLSGRHPAATGIPENDWMDTCTGRMTYCVNDPNSPVLESPKDVAGPSHYRAHTLGEWMRAASRDHRSFSITGKDRSAILMAGHQADGVYWWNAKVGFTSSAAYLPALPAWLKAHDERLMARLKDQALTWSAVDGKDHSAEAPGGVGAGISWGLPKTIKPAGTEIAKAGAFQATPFFDEIILDAAETLMKAEHLGHGKGTDLLALGLSATDYVGHRYGPGGPEMEDQLLRLDTLLEGFLQRLHRAVPDAWVVLTADHACADFPERLQAKGLLPKNQSFRLDSRSAYFQPLSQHLKDTFHTTSELLSPTGDPKHVRFDAATLEREKIDRAAAQQAVIAWLKTQPFVEAITTREELMAMRLEDLKGADPTGLTMVQRIRLSYIPELGGGDVVVAFKPHILWIPHSYPATHGTPHDYDRHVPIIFWGGAWKAGHRESPVSTVDIAPTLAKALHITVPEPIDGVARDLAK